jgi:phage-related protein
MVSTNESSRPAEVHFEGDSLEVLSAFPSTVKQVLGFALRQLQLGREPTCQTRRMASIGPGVYELKESDERTWYRAIYLTKRENVIHVLHCFEKDSRKTDRRDLEIASQRLKLVRQRIEEQRTNENRRRKQANPHR